MAELNVDPTDLRMSSDHMDMHHSDLREAHGAANATIEESHTGWVGASAAALQAKIAEWQATSEEFCKDIAAHGAAYRAAADGYAQQDADGAEALDRTL